MPDAPIFPAQVQFIIAWGDFDNRRTVYAHDLISALAVTNMLRKEDVKYECVDYTGKSWSQK